MCVLIGVIIQLSHNLTFSLAKRAGWIVRNRPVQLLQSEYFSWICSVNFFICCIPSMNLSLKQTRKMKYLGQRTTSIWPPSSWATGGAIWASRLFSRTNNILNQGFGSKFLWPLNHTILLHAGSCTLITLVQMGAAVFLVSTACGLTKQKTNIKVKNQNISE